MGNGPIKNMAEKHDQQLMESIALGEEASRFLSSKLAQYIINSAEKKVVDAQNTLAIVDPTNTNEIIRLQTIIRQFDHFQTSLEELVASGNSAYQLYLNDLEMEQ